MVLTPEMFVVYINGLMDEIANYMSLLADDAKLLAEVKNKEECDDLQKNLDKICDGSKNGKWNLTIRNAV